MAPMGDQPKDAKETSKEESNEKDFTIEDDDGFEEFETGDAPEKETIQEKAVALWKVDWDDEDVDIDFAEKLKAEIIRMQEAR